MSIGLFQLLIIALVILMLFGRGRISGAMGGFGKGIKSFKDGMSASDRRTVPCQIAGKPSEIAGQANSPNSVDRL
jgi:sec-independent protein translocase protein TatA